MTRRWSARVHPPNAEQMTPHKTTNSVAACLSLEVTLKWEKLHLVVKATLFIEEVKERHVRIRAPKIHVRDLEVAPDCSDNMRCRWSAGAVNRKGVNREHTVTQIIV